LGEEGNAFEIEAYGMVIDKAGAKELIDKYRREKRKEKRRR
jgi:hypothetical protein